MRLAKVDAALIARFCMAMNPGIWIPPSPEIRRLQALVRRADALISIRVQELNRLGIAHEAIMPSIKEHIAYLDQEIEKVKSQIAEHINHDSNLKGKKDLLTSIPGIGEATIAVILAELNTFQRFERVENLVAFIGLAPKERVSGYSMKGKPRLSKMGHARLKKALYMPALVSIQYNPVIMEFIDV